MNFCESVLDLVGDTPLVRLNNIVEPGMATVLAKMETLNPRVQSKIEWPSIWSNKPKRKAC